MSGLMLGGDVWSTLDFQLSELRDVFHMLHEAKHTAKGKKVPVSGKKPEWRDTSARWEDDDHEQTIRPWLMIPHSDAIDHDTVGELLQAGKHLLESVSQRISERELSPELLRDWGLLNRWAGALQLVYNMEPDARQLRAGADGLDAQRRWFAHYYLKIQPQPRRDEALEVMERFVNEIVVDLPEGPERLWFMKFLGTVESDSLDGARRLTKAFREKLSVPGMKRLAAEPLNVVPSFALSYPPPRPHP